MTESDLMQDSEAAITALQRLIQEGLLRSEPHRGVFVPELTDGDLQDIYFVRKSLELVALRRVMALPGLAILITVLAINLMGDGLRDALDPRQRIKS